jgi:hypothetical protein
MTCRPPADSSTERDSSLADSRSPDGSTLGFASRTSSDAASSKPATPASPFIEMSGQLALGLPAESISSLAGSPAGGSAPPVSARGSGTPRPFCGARWPGPLASYDPDTSSSRTWRTCSGSLMEQSGERWSGTWPRSGTMLSGTVFQQQPSVPRTSVTGSSALLPSPMARTGSGSEISSGSREGGKMLEESVKMLRTPTSAPWNQGGCGGENEAEIKRQARLSGALRLLPTPSATEYGNNQSPSPGAAVRPSLPSLLTGAATDPRSDGGSRFTDLRLSPSFVGWMMGTPRCSECGAEWSDPACPHSVTLYKLTLPISLDAISAILSEQG